jgi:hypothetical protein
MGVFIHLSIGFRKKLQPLCDFSAFAVYHKVDEAQKGGRMKTRRTLMVISLLLIALLLQMSEVYQDNLNITVDSLDAVTPAKLLEPVMHFSCTFFSQPQPLTRIQEESKKEQFSPPLLACVGEGSGGEG